MERSKAHECCTCCACYEGNPAGPQSNPRHSSAQAQGSTPQLGIAIGQPNQATVSEPNSYCKAKQADRSEKWKKESEGLVLENCALVVVIRRQHVSSVSVRDMDG